MHLMMMMIVISVSKKRDVDVILSQVKSIQRHLTVLQLSRYIGIHHDMSASQRLELVAELSRHYDAGLHFGQSSLSKSSCSCYLVDVVLFVKSPLASACMGGWGGASGVVGRCWKTVLFEW